MLGLSVSSILAEPSNPSSSGNEGIPIMSSLPSLTVVGPTPSIPFTMGHSIWGTLSLSNFLSISIPNIPTSIPSIMILTYRYFSIGGLSLGFCMGGGIPSTSTIPMRGLTLLGVGVDFGWNIPSSFGAIINHPRGNSMSGGFKFRSVRRPFPGGTSLGGEFSHWGGFGFINTSVYRGFFSRNNFGNAFLIGSIYIPGGNHLGETFFLGTNNVARSATILGEHTLLEHLNNLLVF
jgi:hypothetical protein